MKLKGLYFFLLLISWVANAQIPTNQTGIDPANNGFPDPKLKTTTPGASSKTGRAALDDSTKQIYGPSTMYYFLEADVLNSRMQQRRIDTSLHLFHRYLFQERAGFLTASLGNDGTAVRDIFVKQTQTLGTQLGYNVYLPYAFDASKAQYISTKSPYSDVEFYLGAGGQTRLNFNFARNVDSLWNIGFQLQRLVTDKALSDDAYKTGDLNLTGQWGLLIHSNYRSKNNRYRILGHLNYFDQGTKDQGGIKLVNGISATDALKYTDNTALLTDAKTQSNDKFLSFHVYHEFVGFKGLQLFQRLDASSRQVKFRDLAFETNLANKFYPKTYIQYIQAPASDSLYNENQWSEYSHQTGLKGIFRQFTYRAHLKQRYWSVYNPLNQASLNRFENYVGLWLHQNLAKDVEFTAEGEYLLGADYSLKAAFESPWFYTSFKRTSNSPSIANNWVYNTSYRWNNDFKQVLFDQLEGGLKWVKPNFYIKPSLTVQRIGSYIYFDSIATPTQTKEAIGIFRTSVAVGGMFRKFEWHANFYANTMTGPDVIRMPNFVANGNLAFNVQYKKLLYMQFGIDIQHQSAYFGDAYMPTFQAFHLQNQVKLPAFVQIDPYVSLRINRVRLFFKMANVTQGLITDNYYAGYLYPAMGRGFAFGVKWLLFD